MAGGFFEELKRRKVVRVATAYVVFAWVLLQLGDVVIEPLGLPDWIQAALIVGVTALFPVVLILSWLFDLTRKGLVRDRGPAPEDDAEPAVAEAQERAGGLKALRVAVLPFVDMGAEQADAYIGDGVAEEVLHALATHPELTVIARASSFRFRGLDVDLGELRQKLDVTHVLSGTVRRAGEKIRVRAQLVDARDETNLWSESFDRTPDDLFELEEDVAQKVAHSLVGVLGMTHERSWGMAPEAYDEFLMAVNDLRGADFPRAIEHARRSIAIDAENPRAHTLIGDAYLEWPRYGYATHSDDLTQCRQHADTALGIDPNYPPARVVRAMLSLYLERDYAAAFRAVADVSRERPGQVEFLPLLYSYGNRYEEAVEVQRFALRADPLNVTTLISMARRLNWLGRNAEADKLYERARAIQPFHILLIQDDIELKLRAGEVDEATRLFVEAGRMADEGGGDKALSWVPMEAYALWLGAKLQMARGRRDDAHEMAVRLEKMEQVTPTIKAETYLTAGDLDGAYRLVEVGLRQFDIGMYDVAWPDEMRAPDDPNWLAFQADPRYQDLLRRLGIDEASLARVPWVTPAEILGTAQAD